MPVNNFFFNFQKTLDNFYSHQHKDGYIGRQLFQKHFGQRYAKDDPASTGPNILPWAEWEYYCITGDTNRLRKVFAPLMAYHKWLQLNRTWQSGGYWTTGLACGMDNQPRVDMQYSPLLSHGFMTWLDACAQQYLSCEILIKIVNKEKNWKPESWADYLPQSFFERCEVVLSYVTNTMSFLRVGAFVLVHAGMMMVVFTIADMFSGGGYIIAVVVGNIVVTALEALVAGIQVVRLEFYEMFSKFFEGQGRPFTPVTAEEVLN